ncbi:hypothetical protein LCGC14_2577470 [marine sediment metagenome]|uniref:Uncharacterized protein n=1 Tax=marine sediment metagenome TaxID=412755 RepID=A0A0F9D853_9ZZZZ
MTINAEKEIGKPAGVDNRCGYDDKCGTEAVEEHTCPFQDDVHDNKALCRCCGRCKHDCADEV